MKLTLLAVAVATLAGPLSAHAADPATVAALARNARTNPAPAARFQSLWLLHQARALDPALLTSAIDDPNAAVRKNALQIVTEQGAADPVLRAPVLRHLRDADPCTRLQALIALGSFPTERTILEWCWSSSGPLWRIPTSNRP